MNSHLFDLQNKLTSLEIDAFLVPTSDQFQNEFVPPHDQRLAWVSGFTGSAGFAIVEHNKATLFVDSRYTLQAHAQAPDFEIRSYTETDFNCWAIQNTLQDKTVGFDPWLHTQHSLDVIIQQAGRAQPIAPNPIDALWKSRPEETGGPVSLLSIHSTGTTIKSKCMRIGKYLAQWSVDTAFFVDITSSCWLLNMRGSDIPNTPVVLCYTLLHKDGRVNLFSKPKDYPQLPSNVSLHSFNDMPHILSRATRCLVTPATPVAILNMFREQPTLGPDPCALPKACKNATEISGMKEAQRLDGIAMRKFLQWLEANGSSGKETEISAARKLEEFRRTSKALHMLSFNTISASGSNAALPHYQPTEKNNAAIKSGDMYLVDSGGQYFDLGTTDITRTFIIGGQATSIQKHHYTLVLKGHIALAMAVFPKGTTGAQLDVLARQFLWRAGLNFGHSTGHGVGHYLSVHEGPQSIAPRSNDTVLELGMILSNEPGLYLKGQYGIRLENLMLVVEQKVNGTKMRSFETLTYVPFDENLIDRSALSKEEKKWLDTYQGYATKEVGECE